MLRQKFSNLFFFKQNVLKLFNADLHSEVTQSCEQVDPLSTYDYFGVRNLCNVEDLFSFRAHLGHKESVRNPYMVPYLFGNRQGIDIFDLNKTIKLLGEALNFVAHVSYRGGIILFISRHLQTIPLVEKVAKECGEYSHCRPWISGHFTDPENVYGVVTRLPDCVIFLHCHNTVFLEHAAVRDAAKLLIPTVAIVDSNCDPRIITYPIPGNDDSICTIRLWLALFQEAIRRGKEKQGSKVD